MIGEFKFACFSSIDLGRRVFRADCSSIIYLGSLCRDSGDGDGPAVAIRAAC
jgi:hypothetical protein